VLRVADPKNDNAPARDASVSKTESPSATATAAADKHSTPTTATDEVGVGVNAATANAVSRITSMYQFKNLDETCLTLAGTALQAEFQLLANDPAMKKGDVTKAVADAKALQGLIEDESTVHVWKYCKTVFKSLLCARAASLPECSSASPTATPTPGR
jgi:hypothetical protein